MEPQVHRGFLLDGSCVAHVQVTLFILQPRDVMLQRNQESPHVLIFRLKTSGPLRQLLHLLNLGLQRGAAGALFAGFVARRLELFLHPRYCSDQILRQLRVLYQACRESDASTT